MRVLRDNAVSIVSAFLTFAVTYGSFRATVGYNSSRLADVEPRVRFMEMHGHEDHERRIQLLENQKGDVLASAVKQQGEQIGKLAELVSKDHDSIVKMAERLEARR